MLELLIEIAAQTDRNAITKYCLAQHQSYAKVAACAEDLRAAQRQIELDELRAFLKENPQYRYAGMALPNGKIKPLDPCWGKTRKYGTEKGC
jgi:hypothetical protein